jgi:TonB family protein
VYERLLSFLASLCLHLGLFSAILFWPAGAPILPPPPGGILIDGLVSINPLPGASARNPRQDLPPPPPVRAADVQPQTERQQPDPASVRAPEIQPRAEIQPSRVPPPPQEAPVIPKEPQRAANATPPALPARNASSNAPGNATRRRNTESLDDALADMARQARRPPRRGEDLSSALADLGREIGGPGQARQGGGAGTEGTGLGVAGAYADSVASRIKPNWAMAERTDRTNYVAVVSLNISAEGVILNSAIKTSSGNGLFDASVLQAIRATRQVEAPPGTEYMRLDMTFSREVLSRR